MSMLLSPNALIAALGPILDLDARYASSGATWKDRSGRGTNATQADAAKQATKALVGTVPVLTFDGSNDCLAVALNLSSYSAVTVAALVKQASTTGDQIMLEAGTAYNTQNGLISYVTGGQQQAGHGCENLASWNTRKGTDANGTTWRTLIQVHDRAVAAASEVTNYVNGAADTTSASTTNESTGNFANLSASTWLGARNNGASLPLNGHLTRVVIYPRALTAAQVAGLHQALRHAQGVA